MTCLLIGHRGASGVAPENTLPAFDQAVRDGADAIECDVRLTKDGTPVLLHDETLARTGNDRRALADLTFAEARAVDVGYWKGPEWAGTRIPALIEALWWSASAIPLILELKTAPDPERLVDAVARAVRAAPSAQVMTISSFDFAILEIAARILPDVPRAYVSVTTLYEDLERARAVGVSA
ncbi:MAG: glycerophosphodiester phosphodiesterase, partial [Dehalococcoidia bacterium]|nr:glycerophosphodiester phosphodiesterase [Dehalococcoidia bacterium]